MSEKDDNLEIEHYAATVRREDMNWRAKFDAMLASDRAAVDIGISFIKTLVFINAGSLVAVLAFAGQLWDKHKYRKLLVIVLEQCRPFVMGIIFAGIAFGVAYIYQSFVTAKMQNALKKISEGGVNPKSVIIVNFFTGILALVMLIFGFASLVGFAMGILNLSQSLKP